MAALLRMCVYVRVRALSDNYYFCIIVTILIFVRYVVVGHYTNVGDIPINPHLNINAKHLNILV